MEGDTVARGNPKRLSRKYFVCRFSPDIATTIYLSDNEYNMRNGITSSDDTFPFLKPTRIFLNERIS